MQIATSDLFSLKTHHRGVTTRPNPASHILAYTHGFAYICGCLSLSLFFNSDVDVFMRMAAFLYSTRISV